MVWIREDAIPWVRNLITAAIMCGVIVMLGLLLGGVIKQAEVFGDKYKAAEEIKSSELYKSIWTQGYNANKAGVPANANTHIRYPSQAKTWLEGWMAADADKKQEAK